MESKKINIKDYRISFNEDFIIVDDKKMKVVTDYEFVYKLQKTQIRAIDGAEGLCKALHRWISDLDDEDCYIDVMDKICFGDPLLVWSSLVISHILKNGKQV